MTGMGMEMGMGGGDGDGDEDGDGGLRECWVLNESGVDGKECVHEPLVPF